ncbi:MAG: succinate dehydrogenase cytochrome b subunit [Calditrichia bacterium]
MERRFLKLLFGSTVGQKYLMAIAGLAFYLFLIVHLIGNTTLFFPPEAINTYAHTLEKVKPVIIIIELILLAIFALHFILGAIITLKNRAARPQHYKLQKDAGGKSKKTISSTTMIWSGIVILVFVVLHLIHFKFGPRTEAYTLTVNGQEVWNLHKLVVDRFQSISFLIFYLVALLIMAFHLRHAFWSSFQSLGWGNDKYTPLLINLSTIFSIIIGGGYIIIALFAHFKY